MSASDGIGLRPVDADSPADQAVAVEIVRQCELAATGWTDSTLESVSSQLTGPRAWREQHRFADVGGQPMGLLAAELNREAREVFLDAYAIGARADDIQRGLLTVGLAASADVAAHDAEALRADDADPFELSPSIWQALTAAFVPDVGYSAVIRDLGFRPIRRFWRMSRPLDGVPTDEPPAPTGVTRRLATGPAAERTLFRLFEESFAEHFGHQEDETFEGWMARIRSAPGTREDGWWIAELDGRPVGMCIVDDSMIELDEGYVRTLGVLPDARGHGIGTWLLRCAAVDAVRRGRTAIALHVDGANTTGATALYESVGYRTSQEFDVYCYPLSDSALSRKASPQT